MHWIERGRFPARGLSLPTFTAQSKEPLLPLPNQRRICILQVRPLYEFCNRNRINALWTSYPLGGTFDIDAHQSVVGAENQRLRGFLTPSYLADNQALAGKSRVRVLQTKWSQCVAELLPIGGCTTHMTVQQNESKGRAPFARLGPSQGGHVSAPAKAAALLPHSIGRACARRRRTGCKPVLQAASLPRAACSGIVAALFLPHLRGKECLDC